MDGQPQTLSTIEYLDGRIAWLKQERLRIDGSLAELEAMRRVSTPVAGQASAPDRATRRRAKG